MAETLFLRFAGDDYEWLIFDHHGRERDGGAGARWQLDEAVGAEFQGRAILVAPGEDVRLTTANVPTRQHRQLVQAVPFVVEEQLAADVDDCFFALGARNTRGDIAVSVVDRALLEGWIERISDLDFTVTAIVPESALVLPCEGTAVVIDGPRAHIRWDHHAGMTVPVRDLPLTVSLVEGAGPVELTAAASELDNLGLQISELEASGETVTVNSREQSAFCLLCCHYDDTQTNLLQGPYKVEVKKAGVQLVWRSVAMLLGFAVLLHLLMLVGQGWYLAYKAKEYEQAALELYRSVFPDDQNVRDIRRRWRTRLGKSDDDNLFISLFARASEGLPATELTLNNVNFNESRGDLILQVTGSRSEALVEYAQELAGRGLDAEIGTINQESGAVRGSIRIKVGGGAS